MKQQIAGYVVDGPYFDVRFLPSSPGIYLIADSLMRVIDVGGAESLAQRLANGIDQVATK